jgi:SAM-dependent methyltransferase
MSTAEAYETYFASGDYDARYPRPNARTLATVLSYVAPGDVVVDIGAGNGRYAIAMAQRGSLVIAVERSANARTQLIERARAHHLAASITVYSDLSDVPAGDLAASKAVLMLFGVLGHMSYAERAEVLRGLAADAPPGAHLIGSVPNRLRRFRREQSVSPLADEGASPRFAFGRRFGGQAVTMEYTAFSPGELRAELMRCGWLWESITPESVLPESIVTTNRRLGPADRLLSGYLPASTGHCLLYVAVPRNGGGRRR